MSKALSSISAPYIPHACNPGAGEVGAGGIQDMHEEEKLTGFSNLPDDSGYRWCRKFKMTPNSLLGWCIFLTQEKEQPWNTWQHQSSLITHCNKLCHCVLSEPNSEYEMSWGGRRPFRSASSPMPDIKEYMRLSCKRGQRFWLKCKGHEDKS